MNSYTESLVTIGITAFNEGEWLKACWESVLKQNSGSWRALLILDGGADDKTTEVFNATSHPRLKKIKQTENLGPYTNRTYAINTCGTRWYVHLDADDTLPPDAVSILVRTMKKHPEAEFLYGDTLFFDNGKDKLIPTRAFTPETFYKGQNITGTSPIRVSLFEKVGGYNKALLHGGADWDFWIGVAECGAPGACCESVTYHRRRRRQGNVGSGWRFRRDKVAEKIIQNHPQFFAKKTLRDKCLGHAYELMAKDYRAALKFDLAGHFAEKAISVGCSAPLLQTIVKESRQPVWRKGLRILYRMMTSHRKRL